MFKTSKSQKHISESSYAPEMTLIIDIEFGHF